MIKKIFLSSLFLASIFGLVACSPNEKQVTLDQTNKTVKQNAQVQNQRPNILLITVDDLGYADLGAFGSEIETPNIDALIGSGLMLTNFHTAPTCSPTRSMLMSGTDNHLAGLGVMEEVFFRSPQIAKNPGYEGHLNDRVVSLPQLLKDVGYRTYITGKWHLGLEENTSPTARGFDRSFVLLDGGAGHFDDLGIMPFRPKAGFRENGKLTTIPKDFYSSKFYSEKIVEYIQEDNDSDAPFFAFLSFTAPHWPIQAPEKSIAKYHGRYDAGYEVLFQERLNRQKEIGLIAENIVGQPLLPEEKPWAKLTEQEKKVSAKKMEIYAAMIDDVDIYIGKVVQSLKELGVYDNTLIFFMSDNGAQAGNGFAGLGDFLAQCCNNSYENMGKHDSYFFVGSNWARASSGQSRLYKGATTEGGIRAPAFISYPGIKEKGTRSNQFLSVLDILPTFLELAETEHPGTTYKNKAVYPPKGASMTPLLENPKTNIHSNDYVMGWELHGKKAIRQGDWKIVLTNQPWGNSEWQLFNVKQDPTELNDLSTTEPEKFQQMLVQWQDYAESNGVIDFDKAVKEDGSF